MSEGVLDTTPDPALVIDDSRTIGNGPFELLVGREFKLKIWEDMVRTMRVKEVARFTCPFQVREVFVLCCDYFSKNAVSLKFAFPLF